MYEYSGNPLYNPMVNPYLQAQRPFQQQPRQEVVKVNGENGARAYQMPANSSALLLDESGVIVWLVTTDGAGYKSVAPFDISPHEAAPAPNYNDLEQRISALERMMNNGTSGNSSDAQRSTAAAGSRPDQAACVSAPQPQQSTGGAATDDAAAKPGNDASTGLYPAAWK